LIRGGTGCSTTGGHEAHANGIVLALLCCPFEGCANRRDLRIYPFNFGIFFGPFFVSLTIATKYEDRVHLGHVVDQRDNQLSKCA
jgi:hypothetical protein